MDRLDIKQAAKDGDITDDQGVNGRQQQSVAGPLSRLQFAQLSEHLPDPVMPFRVIEFPLEGRERPLGNRRGHGRCGR